MKHLELERAEYVQDLAIKIFKSNALSDFEKAEDLAGVFYDVTAKGMLRAIRFYRISGGTRDMIIGHMSVFIPENGNTCVHVQELVGDIDVPEHEREYQDRRFRLSHFICSLA